MNIAEIWKEVLKERDFDVSVGLEMEKHCEFVLTTKEIEPIVRRKFSDLPDNTVFLCYSFADASVLLLMVSEDNTIRIVVGEFPFEIVQNMRRSASNER